MGQELSEAEVLWRSRHSTSHILATAILEMFPDAKLAIGPPIKDGFYYDFDLPRPLSTEDFDEIEERMMAVVKDNQRFVHETWSKDEAREFFADQPYKLELIDGIEDEEVSIYKKGPSRISVQDRMCATPKSASASNC